jgi:hypothetical protein
MMTPDIETHARVWKFRIERKFFQTGCTACAHIQSKTFSASLLPPAAMFKLNFAKVEFGIIERSPTE